MTVGSWKYGPTSGRCAAAREDSRALVDRVAQVRLGALELARAEQAAHVDAVGQVRPKAHRVDRWQEPPEERVGNVGVQQQPLGVHAQLTRRPEARADRALHGPAEVGVGPHVEAVLAAQLE